MIVPAKRPPDLIEDVTQRLAPAGWAVSFNGAADHVPGSRKGTQGLRFERHFSANPPLSSWRPVSSWNLQLPPELFAGPLILKRLPPGPAPGLDVDQSRARARGVEVRLLVNAATAVIRHERFAVAATSPSSSADEAARASQERKLDLADRLVARKTSIEVDLVPWWARSEPGVRLARLSLPLAVTAGLAVIALAVIKGTPAKLLAAARLAWRWMVSLRTRYADHVTKVAVTNSGGRYHLSTCPCFGPNTAVNVVRRSEAKSRGQSACLVCCPG